MEFLFTDCLFNLILQFTLFKFFFQIGRFFFAYVLQFGCVIEVTVVANCS